MQGKLTQIATQVSSEDTAQGLVLRPSYALLLDGQRHALDPFANVSLSFSFLGGTLCSHCETPINKHYGAGFCYTCFTTLARCDLCIVSPERCHLHLGTCREPQWGESFCQAPHQVYLAVSSGPKVGITRHGRLHNRWVDQGAQRARAIATVPTRRAAGAVEARLRRHVSDRTDWRKMVTGGGVEADLGELARQLQAISPDLKTVDAQHLMEDERDQIAWIDDQHEVLIEYPVSKYPPAVMLKVGRGQPELTDNLIGVKGSYIFLRSGVLPFAEISRGDVGVEVGDPLPPLAKPPQLDLF